MAVRSRMDEFDVVGFVKPGRKVERDPAYQIIDDLVLEKARNHPRTLQVELGPSEIGEPCTRRLAYNLMHHAEYRKSDPLPSIVGIAAHGWMEQACTEWNDRHNRIDWIPEGIVDVDEELKGHSDAYHVPTRTVFDWKFPGPSRMKKYKTEGVGMQYRVQLHAYGRGWKRRGWPVDRVACVCLPRGGFLKDKYIEIEDLDEGFLDDALARYYGLTELCLAMEVDKYPERYKSLPIVTGHDCQFCPWFKPATEDTGILCPGYTLDKE